MSVFSEQTPARDSTLELSRETLSEAFGEIRKCTEALCAPLRAKDFSVQSMPDVSPPKWHLAHTTWFFETFILLPHLSGYQSFDPEFGYLFNSYYKGLGEHYPRSARGDMARPSTQEVYAYRRHVDGAMLKFLAEASTKTLADVASTLELGLHHEQQHQELILMDVKYNYFSDAERPIYQELVPAEAKSVPAQHWIDVPAGIYKIGAQGDDFAFDNETPRHRVFLEDYRLASRLVTNGEYLQFIRDGGYQNPLLWLSDGWDLIQRESWKAPLYWVERDGAWSQFTLNGLQTLNPAEPVSHVSYYEAAAYARWAGKRLATEAEWEVVAQNAEMRGNFLESKLLQPRALPNDATAAPAQLFGDVWEWTASPYVAYPRFKPFAGALGEYNGKFMCNQMILRGGSCFTPRDHVRPSYRNFFPPHSRWHCSGFRLAEDA